MRCARRNGPQIALLAISRRLIRASTPQFSKAPADNLTFFATRVFPRLPDCPNQCCKCCLLRLCSSHTPPPTSDPNHLSVARTLLHCLTRIWTRIVVEEGSSPSLPSPSLSFGHEKEHGDKHLICFPQFTSRRSASEPGMGDTANVLPTQSPKGFRTLSLSLCTSVRFFFSFMSVCS